MPPIGVRVALTMTTGSDILFLLFSALLPPLSLGEELPS